MARKKSTSSPFSSYLRSAVLSAGRRRTVKRKKSGPRKKKRLFGAAEIAALRARAAGISSPTVAAWSGAPTGDAAALRLMALKGLSRAVGGARVIRSNPRRKSMRKRHSRRASARRYGNPVVLSNGSRRRHTRRRNSGLMRMFNPDFGSLKALPGKAISSIKSVASVDNAKKAAVIVGVIATGWGVPARFLPQYDSGLAGVGLTALTGAGVAAVAGVLMPSLAPVAVLGAGVAAGLKALFIYGRSWLQGVPMNGIGDFLTLGQIPASMIQGGRGMGDFMTTSAPVVAMGPGKSATLGGENFSNFS